MTNYVAELHQHIFAYSINQSINQSIENLKTRHM